MSLIGSIARRIPFIRRPFFQRDSLSAQLAYAVSERDRLVERLERCVPVGAKPSGVRLAFGEYQGDFVDVTINDLLPLRIVYQNWNEYKTTPDQLILLKLPDDLKKHVTFMESFQPKTVLEFGIFEGGSAVLWSLIGKAQYCGIDLRSENPDVTSWINRYSLQNQISLNYEISQDDSAAVQACVASAFGERPLDLVVDDASHMWIPSRRSFEIAFPLLRNGGIYLLEDWSWAHANDAFWQEEGFWREHPALTNCVFELVMLLGSRPDIISRIDVHSTYLAVHKHENCPNLDGFELDGSILKQGRTFVPL